MKTVVLYYSDIAVGGTSDKEYRVQVVKDKGGDGYRVLFQFGRRGGTLQSGNKTPIPVSLKQANDVYEKLVLTKMREGYEPPKVKAGAAAVQSVAPIEIMETPSGVSTPYRIEDLEEIASEKTELLFLNDPRYWLQNKSNGHFAQIQKVSETEYLRFNKLGGLVNNIPSEVALELKKIKAKSFFMAGEMIGSKFVAENLLRYNGKDLSKQSYSDRYEKLDEMLSTVPNAKHLALVSTWTTQGEKLNARKMIEKNRLEGVVYKLASSTYGSRQHRKFKFIKTLSAIVVGKGFKGHNSATLALLEPNGDGSSEQVEVGRVSLNGKPNVDIGTIVEIKYLYATEGKRLYQPRLDRIRTDVTPKQCTTDQLIYQGVAL